MRTMGKKRIFSSTKFSEVVVRECSDGNIMEMPKTYAFFDLYKEKTFFSAKTTYLCTFCGHKDETIKLDQSKEKDKIVFSVKCAKCNKIILIERFNKHELGN